MKVKTYNSRTREITIEEYKLTTKVEETNIVELDFHSNIRDVKKYAVSPEKHKKKWFTKPALSDVLLGAAISTILGLGIPYFFIGG
jgi:hypothetical protein